jgi:hypothetical protein
MGDSILKEHGRCYAAGGHWTIRDTPDEHDEAVVLVRGGRRKRVGLPLARLGVRWYAYAKDGVIPGWAADDLTKEQLDQLAVGRTTLTERSWTSSDKRFRLVWMFGYYRLIFRGGRKHEIARLYDIEDERDWELALVWANDTITTTRL